MCETCKKIDRVKRLANDVAESRFDAGDGSVIAGLLREYVDLLEASVNVVDSRTMLVERNKSWDDHYVVWEGEPPAKDSTYRVIDEEWLETEPPTRVVHSWETVTPCCWSTPLAGSSQP